MVEYLSSSGMRCPANTHKQSFHVNTSIMLKQNPGKGTSSSTQRGGQVPTPNMPTPNFEETMTEEEFVEWLKNATESPSPKSGNGMKNPGTSVGSGSKRKKKKEKSIKQIMFKHTSNIALLCTLKA
ncbi:hypothetical protein MTR_1g035850 [Medicago truncatula]|uniref:Uncharacterized protein n=1 Tax=Medicago truncatula TaxID=3880 RepID=A0A072VRT1_MEDTR|nr:hypothetical protein MTR_1g035850 [Medicago truncatula]